MRSIMVFLTLGFTLLLILNGCAGSDQDSSRQIREVSGKGFIELKSLTGSDNPYRDDYQEWDEWFVANVRTEPVAFENGKYPEDWQVISGRVTADGYLLPLIEKSLLYHEKIKNGEMGAKEYEKFPYKIQAQGIMEPDLGDRYKLAINSGRAEYYNPVPDWLVENPPRQAMLMPNGDVVAFGGLGSAGTGDDPGCCGAEGETAYRYSSSGELLRTTNRFWWFLYYEDTNLDRPAGALTNRPDGYIYFEDTETQEILSVWDWDGTQLLTTALPPGRDYHPFLVLNTSNLINLHAGQNN